MNKIQQFLNQAHLVLEDSFYDKCEQFTQYLIQWNKVHNLTGNNDIKEIQKNIIDSVWPLTFLGKCDTLVDVGTGAGYPGLILAIAMPKTKVYLVEPRVKRVSFLNFVKNSLQLNNVVILKERIENVTLEEKIDLVTSRAVTNTQLLMDLTTNISNEQTKYLFYKGSLLENEIKCLQNYQYDIVSGQDDRNYLYIKDKDVA